MSGVDRDVHQHYDMRNTVWIAQLRLRGPYARPGADPVSLMQGLLEEAHATLSVSMSSPVDTSRLQKHCIRSSLYNEFRIEDRILLRAVQG